MNRLKWILIFGFLSAGAAFGFTVANPPSDSGNSSDFRISPYVPTVTGSSSLQGSMYLGASCERSHDEFRCMLCNCMREAAGEPYEGKKMVGLVVKTRVEDPRWANDICGVIYEYKQFSWTTYRSDRRNLPSHPNENYNECVRATQETINAPGNGVNHYHADYVHPAWRKDYKKVIQIGHHIFYADKGAPVRLSTGSGSTMDSGASR
jgi:spore germination cell wall hydrolase CwlJ-like protein